MSSFLKNLLGLESESSSEEDIRTMDKLTLNYGDEAIARAELVDKINKPEPLLPSDKLIIEETKEDLKGFTSYKQKYLKYKNKYITLKRKLN